MRAPDGMIASDAVALLTDVDGGVMQPMEGGLPIIMLSVNARHPDGEEREQCYAIPMSVALDMIEFLARASRVCGNAYFEECE